jgi:hypothetical protein
MEFTSIGLEAFGLIVKANKTGGNAVWNSITTLKGERDAQNELMMNVVPLTAWNVVRAAKKMNLTVPSALREYLS